MTMRTTTIAGATLVVIGVILIASSVIPSYQCLQTAEANVSSGHCFGVFDTAYSALGAVIGVFGGGLLYVASRRGRQGEGSTN